MKKAFFHTLVSTVIALILFTSCSERVQNKSRDAGGGFRFEEYDIAALQAGYKDGRFTVSDVVKAYLARIDAIDFNGYELHSILEVNPDAIAIADSLDRVLSEGFTPGPLFGVPVVLKDNIDTHDKMATTAGSRALSGSHPYADSHVARLLREAGAVIIGKANLSEWANFRGELSSSGWSGLGGQTKNPYILSRNPCGSSSGSGVAVSANLTMIAIGTETNGSIVCPSNNNGIVGIKPTVGLISRSGVVPISYTQDTPGPMTRTVRDAAICLGVLTGIDSADMKTLDSGGRFYKDYTQFLVDDALRGKRIGIYKAPLGINYKVDTLFYEAIRLMKEEGAELIEIPDIIDREVEEKSFMVMLYEYKEGLNNYFASLGPDSPIKNLTDLIEFNRQDTVELRYFNQRYLEMANAMGGLDSPDYSDALAAMLRGSREEGLDRVMNEYCLDAIISPTGSPAWQSDLINGDSYQLGSSSPAAISGYPSITVPMGFIDDLPVGVSFFGKAWSEPLLLEIAYSYEQATHHRKAPRFKY